jgi:hypothetical protein
MRSGPSAERRLQARTAKAQAQFLCEFSLCGNVLRAARAAGVGRRTVYEWLLDRRFKELYDEAHEDALDQLEDEARRRAVDGVLEPVVSGGKHVTDVRKYSDTLLITLLKAKRPDSYRDRQEQAVKKTPPQSDPSRMTDAELKVALQRFKAECEAGIREIEERERMFPPHGL